MKLEIIDKYENPSFNTYLLKLRKNKFSFSDVITATHYRSSNNINIKMPDGHTLKISAGDNPIEAIKKELGVQP